MIHIVIIIWAIYWIKDNLQHLINHIGYECSRPSVRLAQIRVGIDLNQPNSKVFIYHEVVSKKLKVVSPTIGVHLVLNSKERINDDVFHSWDQVPFNIYIDWFLIRSALDEFFAIQIILEVLIAQSISFFKLAVSILVFYL